MSCRNTVPSDSSLGKQIQISQSEVSWSQENPNTKSLHQSKYQVSYLSFIKWDKTPLCHHRLLPGACLLQTSSFLAWWAGLSSACNTKPGTARTPDFSMDSFSIRPWGREQSIPLFYYGTEFKICFKYPRSILFILTLMQPQSLMKWTF